MRAGRRRLAIALGLVLAGALLVRARHSLPRVVLPVLGAVTGRRTLEEVLAAHGPAAEERLRPRFQRVGLAHPPEEVALLGFKEERRL